MFQNRFNHSAAAEAAREHARSLHIRRLRLSLLGMFSRELPDDDVRRKTSELALRESALWHFSDDPYAADSLLKIFHVNDRALLIEAGRPVGSEPALCPAA